MATTRSTLLGWLEHGRAQAATHMLVVVDTFDAEDYPVYVLNDQDVREIAKGYDGVNMQRIMEVYDYSLDLGMQLEEPRARHY